MAKKETAEQKLLRIIEEGAKESGEPTGQVAAASATAVGTAQSVAAAVKGPGITIPPIALNIGGLLQGLQGIFPKGQSFGIKQINMIMGVLIIICVIFLAGIYKSGMSQLKSGLDFASDVKAKGLQFASSVMPQYENVDSFLEYVLQRNIFRPYEKKQGDKASNVPLGTQLLSEKLQKLKLVGISWLDSPDTASVMVEQTETGMTYFLKQGESFDEITVKIIYADRVIFGYQTEEMEVRL
ncbi:MAG: hypothetical protein P9M07_03355 [Candidatus Aceula meridiana]|nr:hypothetical protein [Candidatus Aceula meridiana]